MTSRRAARARVLLVAVALLVGAPACGSAPSAGGPLPSASTSATPAAGGTAAATPEPTASGPEASTVPAAPSSAEPEPRPAQPPGRVDQTVPSRPEVTERARGLDTPLEVSTGVRVQVEHVRAVTARAQLPGEVSGPAVALDVSIDNDSDRPLDVDAVVVDLQDSHQESAGPMSASPARPFSGRIGAGRSGTATYVFAVDQQRRDPVTVTVTLGGSAPVLQFTADAS